MQRGFKMKKGIFACIVLLLCMLLAGCGRTLSYDKDSFLENQKSYSTIAQLIYNNYIEKNLSEDRLYLITERSVGYYDKESPDISPNIIYLDLTKEQSEMAKRIFDSYRLDKHSLDSVWVNKGFVCFGNINGRNSLIYSADDVEPNFVNRPSEKVEHVYIEKICDHWYYACDKGKT